MTILKKLSIYKHKYNWRLGPGASTAFDDLTTARAQDTTHDHFQTNKRPHTHTMSFSMTTVQFLETSLLFTLASATLADACGANGLTTTPAWCLFSLLAMWTSEVNTRPIVLSFYIACVTIITDIAYLGAVSVFHCNFDCPGTCDTAIAIFFVSRPNSPPTPPLRQFSRGDAVATFGSFAIIGKISAAYFLFMFLKVDLGGSLTLFPPRGIASENLGPAAGDQPVMVAQEPTFTAPAYTSSPGGYQGGYQSS